jgi:hypothetical protein
MSMLLGHQREREGALPHQEGAREQKKKNEEEVEKQRLEARRVSGRSIAQRVFLFFSFFVCPLF